MLEGYHVCRGLQSLHKVFFCEYVGVEYEMGGS